MVCLHLPDDATLHSKRATWASVPLSTPAFLSAGHGSLPDASGFIEDRHAVLLGYGDDVYARACHALDAWQMFPAWARVLHDGRSKQQAGQGVAMIVRILGLWWINPCRVVTRCDGETSHGFIYGTLPEHAECGEELFQIRRYPDGRVEYVIHAFSRPQHPCAWLGFPLARWWQCRFVRDSQQTMKELCS
jgi:uncharacterized protein (UPF0548 family)